MATRAAAMTNYVKGEIRRAVDDLLSSLEVTRVGLSWRDMTPDQIDRYAAILQAAERDVLRRVE